MILEKKIIIIIIIIIIGPTAPGGPALLKKFCPFVSVEGDFLDVVPGRSVRF
jgi:hypothetical protein